MQDGPNNAWPPALLGRLIREAVDRHAIDEVGDSAVCYLTSTLSISKPAFFFLPSLNQPNIPHAPSNPIQIVTFDAGGVSGHPNHGALAQAIAHIPSPKGGRNPKAVKVWCLETTSFVRKYLGVLDAPLSFLLARRQSLSPGDETETWVALNLRPWVAYSAMLAHASQFVWYRRLFILFSRYTYVNTLVAEPVGPAAAAAGQKEKVARGESR
jgi:hypothetical protein